MHRNSPCLVSIKSCNHFIDFIWLFRSSSSFNTNIPYSLPNEPEITNIRSAMVHNDNWKWASVVHATFTDGGLYKCNAYYADRTYAASENIMITNFVYLASFRTDVIVSLFEMKLNTWTKCNFFITFLHWCNMFRYFAFNYLYEPPFHTQKRNALEYNHWWAIAQFPPKNFGLKWCV